MLAIIGGSGLSELPNVSITRRQVVRTPYGEPSCGLTFGEINGLEVVFLARHGYAHTLQPHEINYRANIWALAEQKVSRIIAVASVGGIRTDLTPGTLVVPDQLIDYTYGRSNTYFEGAMETIRHIDFTDPYSPDARACILLAAKRQNITVVDGGTYACTQGPRLETAAEIRRLEGDGADMVGMTGMPEAVLARELGVPYASLCLVGNYAAGKGNNQHRIDVSAASQVLSSNMEKLLSILGSICADEFCSLGGTAPAVE
ncbi:S-methyl-5'-thioinosine phosphorylase [Leeia sp. TBRC 13508]|uniref:Probable S-methyl-5'-thioinosine phosphorylase n=1 Tax=Leeia speluncae TaxID=2884804 RepID=A0ABS8D203_9NEIS|nr:S-methyl-5'-thioinosine phosphorylase [Leeia speluncae]MCB6182226.1 S-methyl-5'-thioinosine phosphorylase [Leeia speluncae]